MFVLYFVAQIIRIGEGIFSSRYQQLFAPKNVFAVSEYIYAFKIKKIFRFRSYMMMMPISVNIFKIAAGKF